MCREPLRWLRGDDWESAFCNVGTALGMGRHDLEVGGEHADEVVDVFDSVEVDDTVSRLYNDTVLRFYNVGR